MRFGRHPEKWMGRFAILFAISMLFGPAGSTGVAGTDPDLGGGGTVATGGAGGANAADASSQLEMCEESLGTIAVQEDQNSAWYRTLTQHKLGSTVPVLRTMIQQSNCFVVVERGGAMKNMKQERDLAESGEIREGSNLGKGQMVAADYTMSPSITFSQKGTSGVGGLVGGLFGRVAGAVAGGLKANESSTTLLLIDNRSGVQLAAAVGSAKNYDFKLFGGAGGGGIFGGAGGYSDTPEGKVLIASFMDSYNKMVKAVRNYRAQTVKGGLGTGGRLGVQGATAPSESVAKVSARQTRGSGERDQEDDAEAGDSYRGSKGRGKGGTVADREQDSPGEMAETGKVYSPRFDFVPGEKTLYFDDFNDTSLGDYPARWTMGERGGQVEVAEYKGKNWLKALSDGAKSMKNSQSFLRVDLKKHLPEKFTVEFDVPRSAHLCVVFSDKYLAIGQPNIAIAPSAVRSRKTDNKDFPSSDNPIRHVSIAVSGANLKVYFDDQRVLLDPEFKPEKYIFRTIGIQFRPDNHNASGYGKSREDLMITNFRLAEGGKDYGKELVEIGRIVTHGITFDSGSDMLRPESGPTLRKILKLLQEDADLRFEVQGHTDSQGGDKVNRPLSGRRANAVRTWLINQGIEESRLTGKGLGSSKPIDSNETSEGRANNRRVEFVKI